MELINFDKCQKDYTRAYGGMAGRKIPIIYEDEAYLLKLPGNLKDRELKNVELSYSNSPFSEYIGSHIYEMLGIDVHKTLLGVYHQSEKEKDVCACRDFEQDGGRLREFRELKVSFSEDVLDSDGRDTDGNGTDLIDTLETMAKHPLLQRCKGVTERFWDMFVVDALIGNPDRNNGNWGILVYPNKQVTLAPVYDNGSCLNCRWSDEQIKKCMEQQLAIENQAYRARTCIYKLHGKNINPYHFLMRGEFAECDAAIKRLVPRMDISMINGIINKIPCISEIRKQYYKEIIKLRITEILQPAYKRVIKQEMREDKIEYSKVFGCKLKNAEYNPNWKPPKDEENTDYVQPVISKDHNKFELEP